MQETNKKKEMKMEYLLMNDIVAKALCVKAGSFDVVTSEKFDLMVAISDSLRVNWAHVLFQTLVEMMNTPTTQSQGFVVQVSVLIAPTKAIVTAKEFISLKDTVSFIGLNVKRIKDDAFMVKHTTLQFKRHIAELENSLFRHFADSQQHLVDELALVKSQLAEMIDCLKELRDAKNGEGTSTKKR
ncbi:hypothetical protein F511_28858 [Dorcoceras hygrometricum]|uniref:Uncharacterized protein n=1 Tax=Dorcoceras hygrometricum TaxID=472368 RepID=A0A2Z7C5F3_9LAMI|nr:hypothetical protein F511_28858 [Dorcoceras hygrometricum]